MKKKTLWNLVRWGEGGEGGEEVSQKKGEKKRGRGKKKIKKEH